MTIPFMDLSRQYKEIKNAVEKAVLEVMQSMEYVEGSEVKNLEQELADYLSVKHVITCGNGTDALRIALQAAGVNRGDEVITTPFTFFATAEAISQIGAIPVFADIKEDTLNIDCESIRKLISNRTKAVLPVHIFGNPAEMDDINDIAKENGISVIEDACQAIGSEYKGRKGGGLGNVGWFSFYPTKNLGGFGDGGMITTNDDDVATICRAIKGHAPGKLGADAYELLTGNKPSIGVMDYETKGNLYDPYKYYNYLIGCNSRLDSMQAAVLRVKLNYLDKYNQRRNRIAGKYSSALSDLPIGKQKVNQIDYSCFHQYVVLVDDKEKFSDYLRDNGIGTGAFYPVPLHLQVAFRELGYEEGSLPISERVCSRAICLPVFPELTDDEVDYIIERIIAFF